MSAAARLSDRGVRWVLPPAIAWVAASMISWLAAHQSHVHYWSIAAREHWDSGNYLSIARSGYALYKCPHWVPIPHAYCGNSAWFPGYPLLVRALSALGLPTDGAAVLIPEVMLFAMFVVLWWLLEGRWTVATGLTMAIGAVFPGGIYFHAAFPMSMAALALLVVLVGFKRSSWVLVSAGGFAAVLAHPSGQVVLPVLVLSILFAWRADRWPVRILKGASAAAVAASSIALTHWMQWRGTGRWNAYTIQNRTYFHTGDLRNPITAYFKALHYNFLDYYHPHLNHTWLVDHSIRAHQPELLVNTVFLAVVTLAVGWRLLRDRVLPPEEWAALLMTCGIFVLPFLGGVQSWYRGHALMFVALILVKSVPRWLQVPLLMLLTVQYVFLASMFFSNVLV
ncbi:MAG: hypothetical protein JWP74_3400 [Marmoricola sp.]|nr:hypothetical protein [Marmoricola sp.]